MKDLLGIAYGPPRGIRPQTRDAEGREIPPRLECDRPGRCPTRIPVQVGATPEQVDAAAAAHGFVRGNNGRHFCSRACLEAEAAAPSGPRPLTPREQKLAAALTRVSVRRFAGHDGAPRVDAVCDHAECETRSRVHAGGGELTAEKILKAAQAFGFVQSHLGTFCSLGCEKRAASDKARGIPTTTRYGVTSVAPPAPSTVVLAGSKPPAPPAPKPAPAPEAAPEEVSVGAPAEAPDGAANPGIRSGEEQRSGWDVRQHGGGRKPRNATNVR